MNGFLMETYFTKYISERQKSTTGTGSLWCCTRHSGAAEKYVRTKEKASRLVFWCAVRVTDGFEVRVGLCFVCYVDGQFDG